YGHAYSYEKECGSPHDARAPGEPTGQSHAEIQPSFRPCIKTLVWLKRPTTIKISAIWASVYPSCCTAAVWNSSQASQLFSAETTMEIISLIGFAPLPPSMMLLYCRQ